MRRDIATRIAALSAACAALLGILALLGWGLGVPALTAVRAPYRPIAPSAACALVILGLLLAWLAVGRPRRRGLAFAVVVTGFLSAYGLLEFIGFLIGADLNREDALTASLAKAWSTPFMPMSPAAGALMFLVGAAMLALLLRPAGEEDVRRRRLGNAAGGLGAAAVAVAVVFVLSYAYGVPLFYRTRTIPIAASSALGFLLLGIGAVAAAGPEQWPLRALVGTTVRARLLRAFLPLSIIVVFAISIARELVPALATLNRALESSLLAVVVATLAGLVAFRLAGTLGGVIDRAQAAQREAEESLARQRALLEAVLDQIPVGVHVAEVPSGRLLMGNRQVEEIWRHPHLPSESVNGYQEYPVFHPEDGRPYQPDEYPMARTVRDGEVVANEEIDFQRGDGTRGTLLVSSTPVRDQEGRVALAVAAFHDITERKQAQRETEVAAEFLHLVNQSADTGDLVRAAASFFHRKSGCEAVGIRLKEGDDYPYFEARGFPDEFIQMETSLCARDELGEVVRDGDGYPIMACMCGNVIQGRFDPSKPFFTEWGSFWTNCTTELLATTTEADRQARTRNRCNGEGYESVALIPLRVGEERLGLLQLNDRQPGRFSPELIASWERLADHLAVALSRFRAQEALRESEQRWATTLISIGDAVIATDVAGTVTFMNRVAEQLTGWTSQEAAARPVTEVFHIINESSRQEVESPVAKVLREGMVVGLANHTVLVRRDGGEVPIDDSGAPIRDQHGRTTGVVLVFHDISGRKQAEEALRESEARHRSLFENMLDGYAYCRMLYEGETPQDFVYLDVNSAFERLTGLKDVVGKRVSEVIPGIRETDPEFLEIYGRVARSGKPERFEAYLDSLRMWLSIAVYSPAEEHFVAVFDNITERRQAEQALRESEAKYRDLFENMTEEVHFWQLVRDEEGRIKTWRLVDANPPTLRTWGRSLEEIKGKTTDEIFGPGATKHYLPVVQKIMTEGAPYSYEDYFPNLDKYFRFTSVPLGDYFITTGADVTSIRKAAEQLRESEERYRELVQNANSAIVRWGRDGTITFFNEYAQRFFGYSEEEAVGRHVSMLVPETESTGGDLTALVQDIVDRPQAFAYNVNENLRRDGSRVWMAWTNRPILDANGQVAGVLAIGTDITAQKEAADEVAQHNAVLQAIGRVFEAALRAGSEEEVGEACLLVAQELTGSQIGFVGQIGADGFFHDIAISDPGWSACLMYDQTGHRRPLGNFLIHGLYGRVLADGKGFFTNDPATHPDRIGLPTGHPPLISFLGVPLLQAGQVVGMVAMANRPGGYSEREQRALEALAPAIMESLQRKRAEQALLVAERARAEIAEQMTVEINHRMKNNFTLLSSVLGLQAMTLPQGSTAATALRDAITRLTALSVVHEQLYEARSARVDMRAVLRRIAELDLQAVTPAVAASLRVSGDGTSISSKLGSTLALVANELITNALKHGAPGAGGKLEIEVFVSRHADGLHLRVWNSGRPVPEAFDVRKQTGMGLSLVDGVVTAQLHGSFTLRAERGGTAAGIFIPEREIKAAEFVPVGEGLTAPNV